MSDVFFADISEFQSCVDDSYPYEVLSIRVCDGTYRDHNFEQNFAWMHSALDSGRLAMGIVYTYVRPGDWPGNAQTALSMVNGAGGMHPRMVWMLDVENGGNPPGDQSGPINSLHDALLPYAPVIGYGNVYDLDSMWPGKPPGMQLIVASYGSYPDYPGMVARQYTDGTGFGSPLPQGCAPFGNCDMNWASGLTAADFASQFFKGN